MEPGACADGLGLLQLQTGRPIAPHRTAPRRAPTTTTAPGTDGRNTAGVITPRTLLKTVSKKPRGRRGLAGVFSAPRSAGVCGRSVPSADDISRSLAALMYSGRPVEGAASGATSGVAVFFCFVFLSNQNAPRKRAVGIVLGSDLKCQPSALPSAPACARSFDRGPAHFQRIDPLFQRAAVGTIIHTVRRFTRCKG